MSLLTTLNEDIKVAMRARDKETLKTVRMLKAAVQTEGINRGKELSEKEELDILSREAKQRRDSLQEFIKAGRSDLVPGVEEELKVVEKYLPTQLSEAEVKNLVQEAIVQVGAKSKAQFGQVIKVVLPQVKGRASGTLVQRLVKEAFEEF